MSTIINPSDLPLAEKDTIVDVVLEHGVKVQRMVMGGTRVPPDLVGAYHKAIGESAGDEQPAGDEPFEYSKMSPEDLQARAAERGLEVTGTGKDGNVLKGDLVAALQADDAAE